MKSNNLKLSWVASVASALLLVGCGGGGDDAAGSPNSLSVTPPEVGFSFGGTTCTPSATFPGVTTVLINGGAGDYVVTSTTDDIEIGPVTRVNGVSQFTFRKKVGDGTCTTDQGMIIQVSDVRHNIATVKVVYSLASGS